VDNQQQENNKKRREKMKGIIFLTMLGLISLGLTAGVPTLTADTPQQDIVKLTGQLLLDKLVTQEQNVIAGTLPALTWDDVKEEAKKADLGDKEIQDIKLLSHG
jgi:hypothetical protein